MQRWTSPPSDPEPTWLALTASTTSGVLADHLVGLFDAVATTLRRGTATARPGAADPDPALVGAARRVAGLHRLTLHLRTRRGRRTLPAEVVSGAPTGVRFLRAARPDGTSETGLLERGREAWFPATGPSALAVVTPAHWPGPFDRTASDPDLRGPREPELRLANADGLVLGVVPVHALLGRRLDVLPQVDDDLVGHLASVAAELGCRFEVALRLALTGQVSWLVLPVGVLALVGFSLLWLPRRPRDGVGGVRVLPDGGRPPL